MAIREIIISKAQMDGLAPGYYDKQNMSESIEECGGQLTEDDENNGGGNDTLTIDGGKGAEGFNKAKDSAAKSGLKNFAIKTVFGEGRNKSRRRPLGESVKMTWKELLSNKW